MDTPRGFHLGVWIAVLSFLVDFVIGCPEGSYHEKYKGCRSCSFVCRYPTYYLPEACEGHCPTDMIIKPDPPVQPQPDPKPVGPASPPSVQSTNYDNVITPIAVVVALGFLLTASIFAYKKRQNIAKILPWNRGQHRNDINDVEDGEMQPMDPENIGRPLNAGPLLDHIEYENEAEDEDNESEIESERGSDVEQEIRSQQAEIHVAPPGQTPETHQGDGEELEPGNQGDEGDRERTSTERDQEEVTEEGAVGGTEEPSTEAEENISGPSRAGSCQEIIYQREVVENDDQTSDTKSIASVKSVTTEAHQVEDDSGQFDGKFAPAGDGGKTLAHKIVENNGAPESVEEDSGGQAQAMLPRPTANGTNQSQHHGGARPKQPINPALLPRVHLYRENGGRRYRFYAHMTSTMQPSDDTVPAHTTTTMPASPDDMLLDPEVLSPAHQMSETDGTQNFHLGDHGNNEVYINTHMNKNVIQENAISTNGMNHNHENVAATFGGQISSIQEYPVNVNEYYRSRDDNRSQDRDQ